jgi:hypothetical protein
MAWRDGKALFHQIDDQHRVPFQALGRMHGGQGHGLAALFLGVGAVQAQVSQKAGNIVIA